MSAPTKHFNSTRRPPEFYLTVWLTIVAAMLDLFFYLRAGGLWRDEINSVNIGLGAWANLTHDSFPVFFPLCLRFFGWLGLSDWRLLGLWVGWSMLAALWVAARWTRRAPPIWAIIFVGMNAWAINYTASLRAYGLGSVWIILNFGATWRFLEIPSKRNWLILAASAVLSVQILFHNTALVGAISLAGITVAWLGNNRRCAAELFLAGLIAAVSLLPYWHSITGITASTVLKRDFFDLPSAWTSFQTMLAFPLDQYLWVACGLTLWAIALGLRGLKKNMSPEVSCFAAATLVLAIILYFAFLQKANYYVQTWYFLPLFTLAGICLEACLPRPVGKWRAPIFGGLLATALVSSAFSVRLLDWQMTNVDQLARRIAKEADPQDFVLIKTWTYGQTFGHYFTGASAWSTVPPISDLKTARLDLFLEQTKKTNAMQPVLVRLEKTLRAEHRIWIVGNFTGWDQPYPAAKSIPVGWNEITGSQFNQSVNDFLRAHCRRIERLDAGTNENVNYNERAALFQCSGWRDEPARTN